MGTVPVRKRVVVTLDLRIIPMNRISVIKNVSDFVIMENAHIRVNVYVILDLSWSMIHALQKNRK